MANKKVDTLSDDIAKEMRACAEAGSRSTANERNGTQGEADAQKVKWNEYGDIFTKKAKGVLSEKLCSDIKYMFWFQGWRTANERAGYSDDVASDITKINDYFVSIVASAEITQHLADEIKSMGINIAWYWANTLYGYDDDAKRDKAKADAAYSKITGVSK